ncbi:hypothetical protein [Castellaniella sp.]|uniref:hypothetical protein n=1 Tax=Castellaniella sp. TaxID=1955812 RepID=UPI002AFF5CA4|nr:hypothetical protein [Castellaniella sp.]
MMAVSSHPLIAQYVAHHGIPEVIRSDGRATVIIDDKYRVHMLGARNGWMALSARLCMLPKTGVDRDRFLAEIGRQAAGMLSSQPSSCVVDPGEEALWLQQMVRPDADAVEVDEAVGDFANALSFWVNAVRRAA